MQRPHVLVIDPSIHHDGVALLRERFDVALLPAHSPESTVIARGRDAAAILVRSGRITAACIAACPGLRIVARHGSGVDTVDLSEATRRGVAVTNTGAANTTAVAEYAFAMILAAARRVTAAHAGMQAGRWEREVHRGVELEGKTLGIVGLGKIGSRVAAYGAAFGMTVLAHDPFAAAREGQPSGVELASFETVLERADVLSLHAALTSDNHRLIDRERIASLRRGAILINCARGELVDEVALVEALGRGHLAAAGLDTFEREPLEPDHPLRTLPNVVLSPHIAGQTQDALRRMAMEAATCVVDELSGRRPANVVNPAAYEARTPR